MTRHFAPPRGETAAPAAILLDAARCWRMARDAGMPVQPALFRAIERRTDGILAPVFDSLMALCEAALGRRFVVGRGAWISEDELLLLGLLQGMKPGSTGPACAEGVSAALGCALRSTRIMMALAARPTEPERR